MKKLRVGVVGVGHIGKNHARLYAELPGAQLAAIYDTARWSNSHHAEAFAVLVRDAHFDGEKLRGMTLTTFATSLTPALVQPVLNIATQYKIFDRALDANTLIARP